MHEHLPMDARIELWGGLSEGSWTCACGKTLEWEDRNEVGCLQWHMLECTMAQEVRVRRDWYATIRRVLQEFVAHDFIVEAALACWSISDDGYIPTSAADQDDGWKAPTVVSDGQDGHWKFARNGVEPTFDSLNV